MGDEESQCAKHIDDHPTSSVDSQSRG
jgi:hypothetical protein